MISVSSSAYISLRVIVILAGLLSVYACFAPAVDPHVLGLWNEAEKAYEEERYQEAISKYEEIEAKERGWARDPWIEHDFSLHVKLRMAFCYARLGDKSEAPTMYEKSLEYIPELYEPAKQPTKEELVFLWGDNYYKLGRYEEAEPKLKELLDDYPDSRYAESAYYLLGISYYKLNQHESSQKIFQVLLDRFPNGEFADDARRFIAEHFPEDR